MLKDVTAMYVELYIDCREIPNYNAGKQIYAYDHEYGVTSITKVYVPANEIEVDGETIRIKKMTD